MPPHGQGSTEARPSTITSSLRAPQRWQRSSATAGISILLLILIFPSNAPHATREEAVERAQLPGANVCKHIRFCCDETCQVAGHGQRTCPSDTRQLHDIDSPATVPPRREQASAMGPPDARFEGSSGIVSLGIVGERRHDAIYSPDAIGLGKPRHHSPGRCRQGHPAESSPVRPLDARTAGPTHRSPQSVLAGPERLGGGAFPGRILVSDHRDHRGQRDQRP
jgi:hypothetical protein